MSGEPWWSKTRRKRNRERDEPIGPVSGTNYSAIIRTTEQMAEDARNPPTEMELKRRQRESIAESVDRLSEWLESVSIESVGLLDAFKIWAAANSIHTWVSFQMMTMVQPTINDERLAHLAERATSVMAYCSFYLDAPNSIQKRRGLLANIVQMWKRRDLFKALAVSNGLSAWLSFHALESSHSLGESEFNRRWWGESRKVE